ncbi:P-loop containing nucleoside triphosphate hydrolase protein [Lophium mytilinum]|uniref:Midasin n=1 Tax=Lophium mytilinum TaxID=390894 RepID=A0A6A6R2Y7_9PEZI|nr:P-loop containing nucleoside triphosphate hydrolase protein [Lophium mytilinum]
MASPVVLAVEALNSKATDTIFLEYEHLFVDICARWISSESQVSAKLAAFGRTIPFAPHLAEHVEYFLTKTYTEGFLGPASDSITEGELCELLLAVFRLLSFDDPDFAKYIRPLKLQELLSHSSKIARYLTARIFCLYLHASDAAMEELISKYVHRSLDSEPIHGEWEGIVIDYRFLSLWEEKRYKQLSLRRRATQTTESTANGPTKILNNISNLSLDVHGVLLPRLDGPTEGQEPCKVIPVPTTTRNLKDLAVGLLDPSPLLLTGLAGSGKTLLVRHLAWHLRKLSSMVTLHLNEQSDAKLLLGMYATGAKPGTFSWRPGVLTTAVREGRWIFIEDLDRAPNEVISTLLPLIERGELLIPSRGETIRAARGFKIIATIRTTLNSKGEELVPRSNMIGYRFWRTVGIQMPSLEEFREVIAQNHRTILPHIPAVLRVYTQLQQLYREARFASENGTSLRALTPRDLLKWCDRLSALLAGTSSFTTENMDDVFMEAFDCFAGSLHNDLARARVMACVAEELHIDPQRRDHLLSRREVRFEVNTKITSSGVMRIGRAKLPRHRKANANSLASARPFSTNEYTLRLLEKIAVAVDRKEPLLLVGETGTGKTTCIQFLADQLGRKLVPFNLSQQSESGDLLGGYKPVNIRSLIIPMKDEFDTLFDSTFSRRRNHREWKRVCKLWREALRMLETAHAESEQPKKKRKSRWEKFAADLNDLEAQLSSGSEGFAFSFLEGNIVKAVRNGDWVLLDEINLASSDTLEALTDLLGGGPEGTPSILLTETGNVERVIAHPDFRVFAAMNPATDVGKKDLPPGIRSRFTELYVESPDGDVRSLRSIVENIRKIALDVTELYLEIQQLAKSNILVDGADQQAHFSLPSLCTLRRALFEGFNMSFLTFLSRASEDVATPLIKKHLFSSQSSIKTELGKPLKKPDNSRSYVQEGAYWLRQGPYPVEDQPHYIITPAASTRRYPTSMIEYLAKRSGNKFVQYLGTYISGILIRALREAPTDLLIPETQEVNPAGLNRFLELHFDDIPVEELTEILHRRTQIPESWCKPLRQENRLFEQKSFATLRDLFRWALRKAESVQDLAVNGYMLLAERVRKPEERQAVKKIIETVMSKGGARVSIDERSLYSAEKSSELQFYRDRVGTNDSAVWTGAMRRLFVLVAHAISNNEPVLLVGDTGCGKTTVCQLLAEACGKQLHIVNAHQNTETGDLIGAQRPIRNRAAIESDLHRRLLVDLDAVGVKLAPSEMDLGRLLALYDQLDYDTLSLIPIDHREEIKTNRTKAAALFEWADGSLVHAMKEGQFFLLDEISLADDSVLERLNSVLEPQRTLLLAEKGLVDSLIVGCEGFQFLATMNPGGDYGKKELSPALRNRFTEIWVPSLSDVNDIVQIVRAKLNPEALQYAESMVSFAQWFNQKYNTSVTSSVSIRDTLAWVNFINGCQSSDTLFGVVHGAAMVFVDTLGANPAGLLAISSSRIDVERQECLRQLSELLDIDASHIYFEDITMTASDDQLTLGSFSIPKVQITQEDRSFSLDAPTTRSNAMRVVRALQLSKSILLEGNPGVGKTTLVTAIARAVGRPLARLNLSEQTDLMDLFGSDVPIEGAQAGTFAWRDAPFLKAMKRGEWVLLDEMNLASQSVLEGLNAVLDHRGEVYISELDQTFHKHPDFRVFAAQNPHHQGGGRKGLPASFVNRFTVVYADIFKPEDLMLICKQVYPQFNPEEASKLITFVAELDEQVVNLRKFGTYGNGLLPSGNARDFLDTIFTQRFRNEADRNQVQARKSYYHNLGLDTLQVGMGFLKRNNRLAPCKDTQMLHKSRYAAAESLMICAQKNWPVILVGPSGSGKSSLVTHIAGATGATLVTFAMNADIDAMDLVGGFEQVDPARQIHRYIAKLKSFVQSRLVEDQSSQSSLYYLTILMHINLSLTNISSDLFSLLEMAAREDSQCSSSNVIDGGRFQWVDGILVQALEEGSWLVLDNANLCSASVLDRLNSLLEPDGYLSINEHPTEDGEARVVRPHPNFRIILTMDARYGELSRAMRNRAVEIFLLAESSTTLHSHPVIAYPMESSMYRFRHFTTRATEHPSLPTSQLGLAFDHLSIGDMSYAQSFATDVSKGLISNEAIRTHTHFTNGSTNGIISKHAAISREDDMLALDSWVPKGKEMYTKIATESYHPLNNEVVVCRDTNLTDAAISASWICSFVFEIEKMKTALDWMPTRSLERRPEKNRIPEFLLALWQALSTWLEHVWQAGSLPPLLDSLSRMKTLFWELYNMSIATGFDRATLHTYVAMLVDLSISLQQFDQPTAIMSSTIATSLTVFRSGTHLTSGLCMERVWLRFKPTTSTSTSALDTLLKLEALADRFDAIIWRSHVSFDDLARTRETFSSAIGLLQEVDLDGEELVTSLESGVHDLEQKVVKDDYQITPYFEQVFEGVCQFLDLLSSDNSGLDYQSRASRSMASLLARRPTKSAMTSTGGNPPLRFFHLCSYLGIRTPGGKDIALSNQFQAAALDKLTHVESVSLRQLDSFEFELNLLGQVIGSESQSLAHDQFLTLKEHLGALTHELAAIVETYSDDKPGDTKSQSFINTNLGQCLEYSTLAEEDLSNISTASKAWISLALAGIKLYIPDRPFDPALRPMMERRFFNDHKAGLEEKLNALQGFEQHFTGNETTLRIRLARQELQALGEEPQVAAVVRPDVSELEVLQGELDNLLNVVRPLLEGTATAEDLSRDHTFRQNISHIIRRLTEGYRYYDDITGPAVGFLLCLNIGLSLAAQSHLVHKPSSEAVAYLSAHTPFLGLNRHEVNASFYEAELGNVLKQRHPDTDLRWHFLQHMAIDVAMMAPFGCSELHNLTHDLDQEKEAADHSLYTYRDLSLFPDYEREVDDSVPVSSRLSQDLIFLGSYSGPEMTKDLLHWSTREIGKLTKKDTDSIFVEIGRGIDTLSTGGVARNYNFYFDPNILQHRYRQIREVWPEHATLGEVLRTCDEALAFGHTEPVAKFLTKAEKLHSYVTSALYDELTNLLVSWRQLELTTWARLFDIEMEKCNNAAKSWWFIAYETIVAAPESLQSADVRSHAKGLLKALEGFFSSTTIGQFSQRLLLLKQFSNHVKLRIQEAPLLQTINLALENFISYYSKFKAQVQETLAKGRKVLEKQMKEVILLASWKDTNIEALKQSAKTSHRKLTKLVRKFRALLNQSFAGVLSKGFPDLGALSPLQGNPEVATAHVDHALIEKICSIHVPDWNSRQSRFKNIPVTISIMRSKSQPNPSSLNASEQVNDFITELESSIAELQKATPAYLTEENKTEVKHLKSRKRKLFVDTLKTLKEMGFKWNFGTDALENQDSLSTVLARLPALPTSGGTVTAAESHLYQTLSIMQQVREVAKEHPGDLTGEQVARAIGFLESLLQSSIRQRTTLARTVETSQSTLSNLSVYQALKDPISRISQLGTPEERDLLRTPHAQVEDGQSLLNVVQWLVVILDVGIDLINTQAKLAKLELSSVTTGLATWKITFEKLLSEGSSLPSLPENISTGDHVRIYKLFGQSLYDLESDIKKWIGDFPVAKCTLKQILPFVQFEFTTSSSETDQATYITVKDMTSQILTTVDKILGSMQDVESALANLPLSPEDPAWFIKEENVLSKTINAMQVPMIAGELQGLADSIQKVQDTDTTNSGIKIIVAVFASVLPVFQQYHSIFLELMNRYAALHGSTCKLSYRLAKVFVQIGTQGFCTPSEKSDEKGDKSDKLEDGTGLGDGEGAEDISKDIGDDEDLTDLAQQEGEKKDKEEIEDEEDAVDMGEQEMEGEMGDVENKEDDEDGSEKSEGDVESEVGDVDDLGPSTVDEKMWDDGGDDAEKDRDGDDGKGEKNDEQVAAGEKDGEKEKEKGEGNEDEDLEPEEGAEEQENQGETLDLPDELNMDDENDKDGKESDDDMLGDMDDEAPEPDVDPDVKEDEADSPGSTTGHIEDEEDHPEDQTEGPEDMDEDDSKSTEDEATADTSAEAGAGMDAQDDVQHDQEASANAAKRDEGSKEEGETGRTNPDSAGRGDDKLGDTLEKWYNQQRHIQDATQKDEKQVQQTEKENEEMEADTQALGTATEEQAKTLDESMALPTDENEERIPALPEDKQEEETNEDRPDGDGRPKAFEMEDATEDLDDISDTASSVSEVENQLSLTHLDVESELPTPETARALWLHHESSTHSLAQTLTEHLRLILAPTLATKLRGDFRTGKRLNLKRIIPYIASGYKRDKIWLRRSQPSKRAYQILVALDDSRTLKTLALITRSLAMLEVGEVAVVGFGDDVKVAHDFDKPFTSDAGANKTDARLRGQGRGDDLWQLMLVVSDGICDGHAEIQRLVRKAQESRVMIVFVVVDATATSGVGENGDGAKGPEKGKEKQSVLDLKSVEFGADGKMAITRYMDRFPFRWYLVVRDVADLPGVLATALRQWFAEVVDASG